MDHASAKKAIAWAAEKEGISEQELINEIELSIDEAMKSNDPVVRFRWSLIPCAGERPTAVEFIAFLRSVLQVNG